MNGDMLTSDISPRDPPSREDCNRPPSARMIKAFEQFNRGEYWEQHETLEEVWRAETVPSIRNLYKGIIQVGVGFYHLRRGNYRGAVKVLKRGLAYLAPYAPECRGVNVERLIGETTAIYSAVVELGPSGIHRFIHGELPRIEPAPLLNKPVGPE